MRSFIMPQNLWSGLLGLGLGIAAGVSLASGLEFDRQTAAKFFGALIGSIITVAGAVSLYYLKEHEDKRKRLVELERLIKLAKGAAQFALKQINADVDGQRKKSSIYTMDHVFDRAFRYAEAHEFVDEKIGQSFTFLSMTKFEGFISCPAKLTNEEEIQEACRYVQSRIDVCNRAIEYLGQIINIKDEK